MANKNVKNIGNVERPKNVARNDFNQAKDYGQPNTISPIGRDPDASGTIGTNIDIKQRKTNLVKNSFSASKPYTISDTE